MKSVIIAAGYATRLYPLTENFPKPLLQVGNRNIIERILDDIDPIPDIDSHIIVTNHRFAPIFREWAASAVYSKPLTIIDDGTETNETRLGAVRDLLLAIKDCVVDDDIMVLAADNILEFSLRGFVDFFKEKKTSVIMCYHEPELKKLQRTGIIAVDSDMKVLRMQEKPQTPLSNLAVPPFYIYSQSTLPIIRSAIDNGCEYDAPWHLAQYISEVSILHAWPMPAGRFDIGSLDSYREAQEKFS